MIRSAKIKNFRCLKDVSVSFEPLTVLVGPNGSGKTTLLSALSPSREGVGEADYWQHDPTTVLSIELDLDNDRKRLLEAGPAGRGVVSRADFGFHTLRLNLDQLRSQNQLAPATRLASDGANLANVFGTLTRHQQTDVAKQLAGLVPIVSDVDVQPIGGGTHELRFLDRWNPGVWYRPHEVSDGTILLLAFLTFQYQTPPLEVLAIEEPERGLHPFLIGELMDLLRRLANGKLGSQSRPIQVVLATHSADLLEYAKPEEVRFCDRRAEDGAVAVSQVSTGSPEWQQAYLEYKQSLRSVWLSGGLGGVPGA